MAGELTRIQKLVGRVHWLDRHRRAVSICTALALLPVVIIELADALGADWPEIHVALLGMMIAVMLWWVIEVALVWLTAVWETECERLIRDRGMPPARVVLRK